MMFKAFVGFGKWELFKEPEPRVTEEQKTLMSNENGEPSEALIKLLESTKVKYEK